MTINNSRPIASAVCILASLLAISLPAHFANARSHLLTPHKSHAVQFVEDAPFSDHLLAQQNPVNPQSQIITGQIRVYNT